MVTPTVRVKQKHVFDVREEIAIRDLKRGITKQPVTCLRCKKHVQDPSSSCSGERRLNDE